MSSLMCGDFKRQIIILFRLVGFADKKLLFLLLGPPMHESDLCVCCGLPA